jgi:uncharacterized protein (DUF362 family)
LIFLKIIIQLNGYILPSGKERHTMSVNRREFLKRAGAGAALLAGGSSVLHGGAFAMNPATVQGKSDVSFVGSSSSGTRRKMIADVLEPWRSKVTAGIAGKTIIIKPNLVCLSMGMGLGGSDKTMPVTHVDAIRGLIDFLRSISASVPIIVGDCPALADISNIFSGAGYTALTTEYSGVTLMDLGDTSTMPTVNQNIWTPDFSTTVAIPVISAFTDSKYYIISICRPKTHNCMIMSGVNKNILMAAPLLSAPGYTTGSPNGTAINIKNLMHGKSGWSSGKNPDENKCLSYNLFQLANVIYPKGAPALSVLDAWEGMEGEGPVDGKSVMQYCAVASTDPLAVDRLSAKLMGFSDTAVDPANKATPSYTDMRALVWISNAGLGNYDLSKINFILGSFDALNGFVKSYTLHSNYTGTAKDSTSYETEWTGGPPPRVLDPAAVKDSRYLDPKPFLVPQVSKAIRGGDVNINFSLPVGFGVRLGVFNLQGAEVRRLGDSFLPAGRYTVVWNGCDNRGSRVSAGNYIIKLKFGSRAMCDKISLVK